MTSYLEKYPLSRLRRNRQSKWIRNLVSENKLTSDDLIWPIFLCEGENVKDEIQSMPGVYRYSIDRLSEVIDIASDNKINLIALFPSTPNELKNENGSESLNDKNLVCKALDKIKNQQLSFGVMCDVALDPYTSHGHDGLLNDKHEILNDETNQVLVQQSLLLAKHKADIIAPSDMMDGRIGMIREALENNDYQNILLLSYAAKYASNFYGPFRDAVGSHKSLRSDKKSYQMNFSNSNEALREAALDISEGADLIMVKPGISYLDIISKIKNEFKFPTFAYQVSGEYSMIKAAGERGWIDEDAAIIEQLTSFKRAGADAILTYFAPYVAKTLNSSD